ncbi:MAG: hypothetical protein JWN20_2802, partial [Jatrophihabitantaceae bacterium]|nr:hypothetical protein [Jatrophihabitantaceae bacterium]
GPAQTIRDYYAVMPAGTATGWTMLTADYQRNHAGGLQSYRDFWGQIRTVSVADIQETGPAAVTATITYDYFDGRRYVEVTQFTVVTEGGATKIASSAVL